MNINQPRPTSRDKVDFFNKFFAGHAFLTLEQSNTDGSSILRNVGYYPQNSVYPGSFRDRSVFGEDSKTPYSVSLKMTVSGSEFQTVMHSLLEQQSHPYDLEDFNCVNSVALVMEKIGVHLPMNPSCIDIIFKGVNPGDLGQDIRDLDLKSFQAKNGNRKISKIENDNNVILPSPKRGC